MASARFDPIQENGAIFEDAPGQRWPKPRLALVITGRQEGYFEPCGCAGMDKMKGGMDRRDKLLKMLKNDWECPRVAMDVGGLAKGRDHQAEIKFQAMVDALERMGYSAIGLGVGDLQLSEGELMAVTASNPGQPPSPFVSANVGLIQWDPAILRPYRIIEAAGMKIAVTGILGSSFQKEIRNPAILMADAAKQLTSLLPVLKEQKPDHMVLLAFASKEESEALGQKFPDFDIVVTAGGPPTPPKDAKTIPQTRSLIVEVGEKTTEAIVLGLYDDPKHPLRYQRVPLDSRFDKKSPDAASNALSEMQQIMADYQIQLKAVGFEGLGIHPSPHPQQQLLGRFVGSEQCKTCHEGSYDKWKKTPHAHAFQTLEKLAVPRIFDPECISCHVIGWDTQNFFPYQYGYQSTAATPKLINVGCESCHGPGEAHVAAENGTDGALKEKLQQALTLTKEEARKRLRCQNCHDLDNSPAFNFDTYFPKIEHHD